MFSALKSLDGTTVLRGARQSLDCRVISPMTVVAEPLKLACGSIGGMSSPGREETGEREQKTDLKVFHPNPKPTSTHPKSTVDLGYKGLIRVESSLTSHPAPTCYRPIIRPENRGIRPKSNRHKPKTISPVADRVAVTQSTCPRGSVTLGHGQSRLVALGRRVSGKKDCLFFYEPTPKPHPSDTASWSPAGGPFTRVVPNYLTSYIDKVSKLRQIVTLK